MTAVTVALTDARYPRLVQERLNKNAPVRLLAMGNLDLLGLSAVAFFCSARAPGYAILTAHDQAARWRDEGRCVIGGFHSPVEKECLGILLRGRQPIIICPARGIERIRLPVELRKPMAEGRVLILSLFAPPDRRVSKALASQRNLLAAALSDEVVFAFITPDGHLDELRGVVAGWGIQYSVLTEVGADAS
jgi:predicted Rossmann fold nucleotide-binding protein DprA/Smf involved in DNA uptake